MAQWYGVGLENLFPKGFPGSIPGRGVYFMPKLLVFILIKNSKTLKLR